MPGPDDLPNYTLFGQILSKLRRTMSSSIDALHLRRVWGRAWWHVPEPFGPDGFSMVARGEPASIIVTCAPQEDGLERIHASIARDNRPRYEDLVTILTLCVEGQRLGLPTLRTSLIM